VSNEQQRFYQGDILVNLRGTSNTSTFVSASSEPGYKGRRGYKGLRRR